MQITTAITFKLKEEENLFLTTDPDVSVVEANTSERTVVVGTRANTFTFIAYVLNTKENTLSKISPATVEDYITTEVTPNKAQFYMEQGQIVSNGSYYDLFEFVSKEDHNPLPYTEQDKVNFVLPEEHLKGKRFRCKIGGYRGVIKFDVDDTMEIPGSHKYKIVSTDNSAYIFNYNAPLEEDIKIYATLNMNDELVLGAPTEIFRGMFDYAQFLLGDITLLEEI